MIPENTGRGAGQRRKQLMINDWTGYRSWSTSHWQCVLCGVTLAVGKEALWTDDCLELGSPKAQQLLHSVPGRDGTPRFHSIGYSIFSFFLIFEPGEGVLFKKKKIWITFVKENKICTIKKLAILSYRKGLCLFLVSYKNTKLEEVFLITGSQLLAQIGNTF